MESLECAKTQGAVERSSPASLSEQTIDSGACIEMPADDPYRLIPHHYWPDVADRLGPHPPLDPRLSHEVHR